MVCYVSGSGSYQLVGGVSNSNWEIFNVSTGSSNIDTASFVVTASGANDNLTASYALTSSISDSSISSSYSLTSSYSLNSQNVNTDKELVKLINSFEFDGAIALNIKEWISCKRIVNGKNRPVKLSDIMILVRKRDGVFNQHLTQSLNRHNIKYSSSGSLGFNDDLIIQDFLSIAKFVCLPCDDFNLVHLLKSPFFNFNEDQIFKLCIDISYLSLTVIIIH
jgi:hypothetical protein